MPSAVELCAYQYKLLGFKSIKGNLSIWTYVLFLSLFGDLFYVYYCVINNGPTKPQIAMQFVAIVFVAYSLMIPVIYYRGKIAEIAENCDAIPNLDVPWDVEREMIQLRSFNEKSFDWRFVELHNFMVLFSGSSLIIRPVIFKLILGLSLELPMTGQIEDIYSYMLVYSLQAISMVSGTLCCTTTLGIFSSLVLHLKIHYQLLAKAFLEPTKDRNKAYFRSLCIKQHYKINKIFGDINEIYKKIMFYTYFGLFASTSLTRTLLTDDVDTPTVALLLLVIVVTTAYLSPYCITMEALGEVNEDLRISIYSSDWPDYEENIKKSYMIMIARCLKEPTIRIYTGGPALNLRDYLAVINGTFTYIITSFLF